MDKEKLQEFIEFMKENNLTELEIEEDGKKIKLVREGSMKKVQMNPEMHSAAEGEAESSAKPLRTDLIEIKAPMVGTFYRAPAPHAAVFVEEGAQISAGDVVCIIEAMKLMNEIKSEIKGEVAEVLAENGEPVEYGQALFLIKPA